MDKKIGIILVNYNGEKYNIDCIKSILNSTYKNIEIIVVDNNSTDKSVYDLKKSFEKKIKIIELNENIGFSGANNIGIKEALESMCEYVLLLNNDTIIDSKMIENMVEQSHLQKEKSVVCPKIYYYDTPNIIWSAGGYINWNKGITIQYGMDEEDKGKYDNVRSVEFATGCCLLIPTQIIKQVGFLSEEYFLYYEDTDYCVRIKEAGFNIIYEPKSIMYHKVSASTGGLKSKTYVYYLNRNRLIFNKKYNKRYLIFILYFYLSLYIKKIFKNREKTNMNRYLNLAINDYKEGVKGKRNI